MVILILSRCILTAWFLGICFCPWCWFVHVCQLVINDSTICTCSHSCIDYTHFYCPACLTKHLIHIMQYVSVCTWLDHCMCMYLQYYGNVIHCRSVIIDPTILRPGRLDQWWVVYIGLPDQPVTIKLKEKIILYMWLKYMSTFCLCHKGHHACIFILNFSLFKVQYVLIMRY